MYPATDLLIHAANAIYLLSYVIRDILWLRLLTVLAALCLVGYFALRPEPLAAVIVWNLIFIALNLAWVLRLMAERRGGRRALGNPLRTAEPLGMAQKDLHGG